MTQINTPADELLRIITRSETKKLIGTHIADPDGMFCAVEFFRAIKGFGNPRDFAVIPLDRFLLRDERVTKALAQLEFFAVFDYSPVGKKITYYCDHHVSNTDEVKKLHGDGVIKNLYFEETPACVIVLNKLLKEEFSSEVRKDVLACVTRTDSAAYTTPSPTTEDEFWNGDPAWRYQYLVRTVAKSPKKFIELFEALVTTDVDTLVKQEPYQEAVMQLIADNARIKQVAESITPAQLTIVVGEDDHVINRELMFRLYTGECKVAVMCARITDTDYYKLSFGTAMALSDEVAEEYRVDGLAGIFGGGGHKRASGCRVAAEELNQVITKIKEHFSLNAKTYRVTDIVEEI